MMYSYSRYLADEEVSLHSLLPLPRMEYHSAKLSNIQYCPASRVAEEVGVANASGIMRRYHLLLEASNHKRDVLSSIESSKELEELSVQRVVFTSGQLR